MKKSDIENRVKLIGTFILRVMVYQASVRLSGVNDTASENKAYVDMLLATRCAGKLLRELSGSATTGNDIARQELWKILETKIEDVTGLINCMQDGHLALIIQNPNEI